MFDVDNRFWQFLNKMADQIVLSFFWIACSVPIVTAGASTTAFFKQSMELHQGIEGRLFGGFFQEFKRCFGRATVNWLIQLAVLLFVAYDVYLCWLMNSQIGWFLIPILVVMGLVFWMTGAFTWPLLSHSSMPLKQIWRQAARLMITYLPHALTLVMWIVIGAVIILAVPQITVIVPGLIFYQYSRIFAWIFRKDPMLEPLLDLRKALFV